jgi:uncharacterized SAM-binding protein YcdF (DUF218 family)
VTSRESFCAVLSNGPLLQSDAIIVLCGEDGRERANVAVELLRQQAAPLIVLSGGIDDEPRYQGALTLANVLMDKGVPPERVRLETDSQNTREQAVACVDMIRREGWTRVLLIASAYHMPRAFLTFLKALQETAGDDDVTGMDDEVQIVAVPASQVPWFGKPDGVPMSRFELLAEEFRKIAAYAPHVATYDEGVAYLKRWEAA